MNGKSAQTERAPGARTILGIRFFQGTALEAVRRAEQGGLVIMPAAPALKDLTTSAAYRETLQEADLVLTDSAYMVMIWNLLQGDHVHRLSGLEYLRTLLSTPDFCQPGNTIWVMASELSARTNLAWLCDQGVQVPSTHVYIAPIYGERADGVVEDTALVAMVQRIRPRHVVITLGGGMQEPLGLSLRRSLMPVPAIHCIGAAIAFLSGDQVRIPVWADKYYLGWLLRILSEPRKFSKRYWEARKLFGLLKTYRDQLPPLQT